MYIIISHHFLFSVIGDEDGGWPPPDNHPYNNPCAR